MGSFSRIWWSHVRAGLTTPCPRKFRSVLGDLISGSHRESFHQLWCVWLMGSFSCIWWSHIRGGLTTPCPRKFWSVLSDLISGLDRASFVQVWCMSLMGSFLELFTPTWGWSDHPLSPEISVSSYWFEIRAPSMHFLKILSHLTDGVKKRPSCPTLGCCPGLVPRTRWSDQSEIGSGHPKESPHMLKPSVAYGVAKSLVALTL